MNTLIAMSDATSSHPFPLIRGGGLFLLFVGLGFLLGWIIPKWWVPLAIGGGITGIVASGLSALLPSLGTPSWIHIAALVGSMVLEMGLIYLVVTRYKDAGERKLILAILFVVGAHFITMGAAHGPLIAILGVVTMGNAALGLWQVRIPLRALGVTDALLKLGFGAVMLLAFPAWTYL